MTDDKQAVKTLAEQLVKAMKSVSANTPSKYAAYAANAGSGGGGGSAAIIPASKIVGLPAAFSSIINGIETSAAAGDAIAQQTLSALNHIAAGEFETITADTAMIEKVYATFGDFITLVAEDAQIGSLDVDTIRAGLAEVGLLNIGTASIDMAQIKRSSTQTAFIHESVQGKVYIDDLAVNDANIVNLSAGTVLINDTNGELVELYVDDQGNVSTRAVAYDGSDIINQNSLNGNRIVQNSITTTQLNASEIFAAQGTIMDLIADNIEATRLFANQGFITELQSTIISSDLSENSTIIELTDSINLFASNTSRTFIQENMPIPVHTSDTWFDPSTEEHYVANAVYLPISQMMFGHDDGGNLNNEHSEDYQFSINSNGELMLLVTDEEAEEIILENDIDFEIVNDRLHANGLWRKVDNVAFSNLRVSVDGIVSEVYDSSTGASRIAQNADRIVAIVAGDTSVPYVKTSSIEIKEDKVEIQSAGNVDIKASNFSISFNTEGTLDNKSRVDISNDTGIKVSDSYGNYFQATSGKIGLYDILDTPRLYVDSNGEAFFNGSLTIGGANNVNGVLEVKNLNGATVVSADISGLNVKNTANNKTIVNLNSDGITVYNKAGTVRQIYLDNSGDAIFAGKMSADCITSGTISADRIGAGAITAEKIDSKAITGDKIAAGTIEASNIKGSTITGDKIAGTTITATNIAGSTITGDKIAGGTITANNIKGGTITADQLAADSVTSAQIKAESIIAEKIKNGEIKTEKLDAHAVTAAKIAVGTITATEIATGTITGDRIAGTTITGSNIAGGTIKGTHIDAGTITATNIATGTITGTQIAGTTITGDKIAVGTITSNNIATGTIKASNIESGTITGDKLKAGTITADKIDAINLHVKGANIDDTISADKIKGGILIVGGAASDDSNGVIAVKDKNNTTMVRLNYKGVFTKGESAGLTNYADGISKNNKKGFFTSYRSGAYRVNYYDRDIIFYKTNNTNTQYNVPYCNGVGMYLNGSGNLAFYSFYEEITGVIGDYIESFYHDYTRLIIHDTGVNAVGAFYVNGSISTNGNISATGTVTGSNITASGTKSRVVSTSQYSDRLLYCYETPTPMFGDVGEGIISEDGKCYIPLDSIFAQTISTDQYQVFLQRYGEGDCYVLERHGGYFVVSGIPGLKFGWELKAKQSDFDQLRLERNEEKFTPPSQVYGDNAADHIKAIYDGRLPRNNDLEREEINNE